MGVSQLLEYKIEHGPSFAVLKVTLEPGESISVEPGSYMLHRGEIEVKTSSGGILKGLARALMGGESFFLNTIIARQRTEVWIAPSVEGDIAAIDLNGGSLVIQDGSYLAHVGNVEISTAWRGLRGLLAEGELVWLKAKGTGTVFVNSYGALERIDLRPGEKATIDNMHFVALDDSVKWSVRKFGGLKTFIFGGEGIVLDVEGPGRVWVQTRNLPLFARVLRRFLPSSR
jgi:uncharacterized protein (TIGR00266 family)